MAKNIKTKLIDFIKITESVSKTKNNNEGGYFKKISDRATELNQIAQVYLDKLEFIPNDVVIDRIWKWAFNQMDKDKDNNPIFTGENELAEDIIDSGVPYSNRPRNGSLHYSLGWAMTAQEANLRSLLEFIEGRQSEWIKFKCLADLP